MASEPGRQRGQLPPEVYEGDMNMKRKIEKLKKNGPIDSYFKKPCVSLNFCCTYVRPTSAFKLINVTPVPIAVVGQ